MSNSSSRWDVAKRIVDLAAGLSVIATMIFIALQWKEMRQGGKDTHDLAVQAGKQADAAKAQAEQLTNLVTQGTVQAGAAKASAEATRDIAQRALAQAIATNNLAREAKRQADTAGDALKSSIESANQDRRPWVGLQLLQCNNCRMDTDGSLIIGDLSAVLVNTGRTPAIDMIVSWTFESTKASDPIPTYDAIEKETEVQRKKAQTIPPNLPPEMAASIAKTMELVNRRITPSKEVLAPNAPRGITIIAGLRQERSRMVRMEDQNVVYGLGKVTYYDGSSTVQHTTTFCVMNDFGTGFRYCPTGNEMN